MATEGGGQQGVDEGTCAPSGAMAHSGDRALRVAGTARDGGHSYIYFTLFEEPLRIYADSQLRYWFLPTDDRSRHVAVDLFFTDSSTLRDSGTKTADGVAMP